MILAILLYILISCHKGINENNEDILTIEDTVAPINQEIETVSGIVDISDVSFIWNGTEPFWWFNASGSTLVLREPSDTGPMDTTIFTEVVMTSSGTSVNMSSPLMNLELFLESCSDGMSDLVYNYSSSFTAGATSYTGCANLD